MGRAGFSARATLSTCLAIYLARKSLTDLSTNAGVTQTGGSDVKAVAAAVPVWKVPPHGVAVMLHD